MSLDWTAPKPDPARRLFQVRLALELLALTPEHRECMGELAENLERKYTQRPARVAGRKGTYGNPNR